MTGETLSCLLCDQSAIWETGPRTGNWLITCPYCGPFTVSEAVEEDIRADKDAPGLVPFLSAYVRQTATRRGKWAIVGNDWKAHAAAHAATPIPHKIRALREIIGQRSSPGASTALDEREIAPLIDARNGSEVRLYLKHLEALGELGIVLQQIDSHKRTSSTSELASVTLTIKGWEAISPTAGAAVTGTCFVAMSFDTSLDDAYENGFAKAIRDDCGFQVIRVDRVHHNDDITDRILVGIRTAQFVVADFTQQRPSVYFEAGFAAGLGRTVVWTCRETDFDQLHFDIRQRNHIKWTTVSDLREQLAARIRATVTLPAKLT